MPELPDVVVYVEALRRHVLGQPLEQLRVASPFVLRSVDPPASSLENRRVTGVRRLGKRIVLEFEDQLFAVFHLMIAGRLRWRPRGVQVPNKRGLAAFDFPHGSLLFTEAGTQKRAGLWVVQGIRALAVHDPGGIEPLTADVTTFRAALTRGNHTLKRALTDPRMLSGIGNAFSDEILHAARLSPLKLTRALADDEMDRLYHATRATLTTWVERLRRDVGDGFPERVTAFREQMAVHGRYRQPCPVCGAPVQRIRHADNEVNYCAQCQTGGKVLRDRAFSRLLREDWPRSLDAWEERFGSS